MLANLRALFGVVVDIVLLRRGPEHLPASPVLLAIVIALFVGVGGLSYSAVPHSGHQNWYLMAALIVAVMLVWYRVALLLSNKAERFVQTLTAMLAVATLFTPLVVPVANTVLSQAQAGQQPSTLFTLMGLVLEVWWLVIDMRIVRSAFDWPWPPAVILVLAQKFAVFLAVTALFGSATQPA